MHIVLTWPKSVPLQNYMAQLERADREDKSILFKVSAFPAKAKVGDRCYMVHSGFVRGWSLIEAFHDGDGPDAVRSGESWGAGKYIVRSPKWHFLQAQPQMKGFQGFRYANREWGLLASVQSFETQIEEPVA